MSTKGRFALAKPIFLNQILLRISDAQEGEGCLRMPHVHARGVSHLTHLRCVCHCCRVSYASPMRPSCAGMSHRRCAGCRAPRKAWGARRMIVVNMRVGDAQDDVGYSWRFRLRSHSISRAGRSVWIIVASATLPVLVVVHCDMITMFIIHTEKYGQGTIFHQ